MDATQHPRTSGPIVIAATGGSGTRVLAQIARDRGVYIGQNLNAELDALDFENFADRWINLYMTRTVSPLPLSVEDAMGRELQEVVAHHRASRADAAPIWGWKQPRSIFLVPFLQAQFPDMKFVHLVRDGRDMAFSRNQNQLLKHGGTFLHGIELKWPQPVRSIALWARLNLSTADYAEQRLKDQYLRLRYEDLCADPPAAVARLLKFLGVAADAAALAQHPVRPSPSIGRWKAVDQDTLMQMHTVAGPALLRFGYWNGEAIRSSLVQRGLGWLTTRISGKRAG